VRRAFILGEGGTIYEAGWSDGRVDIVKNVPCLEDQLNLLVLTPKPLLFKAHLVILLEILKLKILVVFD
jgi:hypothetical protein